MRIALLGGGGMLASDLEGVLGDAGHEVHAASRSEVDVTRDGAVAAWLDRVEPELLVNAAAYTQVDGAETHADEAFAVNDVAVGSIARCCRDRGLRAVHVSTDYVFGGPSPGRPWREDDPLEAHGVYARSKLAGERRFRETLGDEGLVVRTQWLFGLAGRNFIEAILRQLAPGAELRVVDDQRGRPSWTRDVARGIGWLVERGARGVVHVANEGEATWFDVAARIVERSGATRVRLERQRTADTNRPAPRPSYSVLDLERFASTCDGRRLPAWTEAVDGYLEARSEREATEARSVGAAGPPR